MEITLAVEEFSQHLKTVTRKLAQQYPNDATIYRADKRIMSAIATLPVTVVDMVGPQLYKYRNEIYAVHDDASKAHIFLDNDFGEDLAACKDGEKVDLALYIIPKLKEHARSLPAEAQKEYMATVVQMLDAYVDYLYHKKMAALQG